MRIGRLDLHAFGPFTQTSLDFGRADALQLVYGPNEAGKSSTLRALTALLYGVPVRTGDAHVHEMTRLRIGATLIDAQGRELRVVRRKGAKNTLLDQEERPLDEALVEALLGGLDERLFRQMFGLDHEHLRAGGEALLSGEGQLGQTLFSAGTGARGVSRLLASLRAELEQLYKPKGKNPKLNAALDALHACQRRTKEAMLSPQSVDDQRRALDEVKGARAAAQERRRELLAEKSRLTREVAIVPLLRRRAELERALAESLASVPEAHDDAALTALLRELERRHGSALAAERELPEVRARGALLESEVVELRARLGAAAEGLRALETPTRARLRRLSEEERALAAEHAELLRVERSHELRRAELEERLAGLDAEQPAELAARVELVERSGVVAELAQVEVELAKRGRVLARGAAQLGLALDVGSLSTLALPADAELARIEDADARHRRASERLADARAQVARQEAQVAARQRAVLAQGELPSPRDIAAARARRAAALEALFADVRAHGRLDPALVARLGDALARADALADELAREAHRAAEWRQLESQAATLAEQRAELAREDEALAGARAGLAEQTARLLAPLGFPGAAPHAARGLVQRLSVLVAQATEQEALRATHDALRRRADELRELLDAACGADAGPCDAPLGLSLERARRLLAERLERARDRKAVMDQLAALTSEHAGGCARRAQVEEARDGFRSRFSEQLATLGFAPGLSSEEVLACLDDLAQLSQKLRELELSRARLEACERERVALAEDVRRALASHAPDLLDAELDVERALAELARRQRAQLAAQRDRVRLKGELASLHEQLAQLGDGVPVAELARELGERDPHVGRARLAELEDELEVLTERLGELDEQVGRIEGGLTRLEQTPGASASAEELESELARARSVARRYYETRLALAILQREIERYRSEHQGPVLERASQLFPRLTLARYAGLGVEYDERDEPVLCCLRHDGKSVRVTALSDGTRDQLYLALRVASIERFLSSNPPLPLVLDDAFVHFDDARAGAALELLGELCDRTQVIFFTHHARMVEIALRALGRGRVALHHLPSVAGVVARPDDGPLFA